MIKGNGKKTHSYTKAVLPISSDKGILLFRKWFVRFSGGRIPFKGNPGYLTLEKDTVFDVYSSHAKYCADCSGALENLREIRLASSSIAIALVVWNPSPVLRTGVT